MLHCLIDNPAMSGLPLDNGRRGDSNPAKRRDKQKRNRLRFLFAQHIYYTTFLRPFPWASPPIFGAFSYETSHLANEEHLEYDEDTKKE